MARFFLASWILVSSAFAQGNPDFSGTWNLDPDKSDDGEAVIMGGLGDPDRMSPKNRRVAERLLALGRALQVLEIRHSASDFSLYDEADNVRIYYIDGEKHQRATPWGEKLETVTRWEGSELQMKTDGKDLGEIVESYSMQGNQLLYTIKMRLEDAKEDVIVRTFYNRAP
jgi:hypothetical protein